MKGPLGEHFRPGVHDEEGRFSAEERAAADWLAARYPGACIHPRHRDPAKRERSPDAMVRTNSQDVGTVTEFKTLKKPTETAVKDNIRDGIHQVIPHGNGHVVIDGRGAGLTEAEARRGYARLLGERKKHGRPMARQVTVVLADSSDASWRSDV